MPHHRTRARPRNVVLWHSGREVEIPARERSIPRTEAQRALKRVNIANTANIANIPHVAILAILAVLVLHVRGWYSWRC